MRLRVLAAAALLLTTATVGIASTPAADAISTPQVSTKKLLGGLMVAPKHFSGYSRALFEGSRAARSDGCTTRDAVLITEAVVRPTVGPGCSLTGGKWVSKYDATTTTDPSTLDIDHVVSLDAAWQAGAWRWDADTRGAFDNDLDYGPTLIAVSTQTLAAKGQRQPETWLPPSRELRCTYLGWWVAVKWRWQLTVDSPERAFLERHLSTCGWPSVPDPSRAKVTSMLCQDFEHANVTGADRVHYQLLNIRYHAKTRMCIQNTGNADNFTVAQEPGADPQGKVAAYPEIYRGCLWTGCSYRSGMPVKVSRIGHPVSTWHARERASGSWNASWELWFGKHRMVTGQADGAELMIWTNLHGTCCHLQPGAPKVHIDGRTFWLSHWRPCSHKWHVCFNYIQFRLVRHTARVDRLRLAPFIRRAVQMKLIRPWWYLENAGAGFEIWQGGRGLATTSFHLQMHS